MTVHLALHIEVKDGGHKVRQVDSALAALKQNLSRTQKALGLHKAFVTSTLAPHPSTPWTSRGDPALRAHHEDR